MSSFSISAAEDQLTEEADGKFDGSNLGRSSGSSPTATDQALFGLLSSLCQKIDSLGTELSEARRDGNQHGSLTASDRVNPSILRSSRPRHHTKGDIAISSVARRHATARARSGDEGVEFEEESEVKERSGAGFDEGQEELSGTDEESEEERRGSRSKKRRREENLKKKKEKTAHASACTPLLGVREASSPQAYIKPCGMTPNF